MKFRVGDLVVVIAGKDKGKQGTILKFSKDKQYVFVEGINKQIKHIKGRDGQPGQRTEIFAKIHISNIAIWDAEAKKPSRIGYIISKDHNKKRISKASKKEIIIKSTKKIVKAA